MLLQSRAGASASPLIFHRLGRCLLFLDDPDIACCIFGYCLHMFNVDSFPGLGITCDACHNIMHDSLFVCGMCAEMTYCSSCVERNFYHSKLHPGQKHEFLKVCASPQSSQTVSGTLSEKMTNLLRGLVDQFGESIPHTENGRTMFLSSTAEVKVGVPSNTAPAKTGLAPRIMNAAQILCPSQLSQFRCFG
jgi:hypothetical protein